MQSAAPDTSGQREGGEAVLRPAGSSSSLSVCLSSECVVIHADAAVVIRLSSSSSSSSA